MSTLQKTVAALRLNGELNELVWAEYQKRHQTTFTALSFIGLAMVAASLSEGGRISVAVIICFWVWAIWDAMRRQERLSLLYTIGETTEAQVKAEHTTFDANIGVTDLHVYRFAYAIEGQEYEKNFSGTSNKYAGEKRPKVGEKIKVLYFPEKPADALPYYEFMNKAYNLRISA